MISPPTRGESDGGGSPSHEERRQQGLGYQGDGPGAAGLLGHVEDVVACLGGAGPEGKGLAAQVDPGDLGLTDPGHGLDRGEVLGPEPRLRAPGPDTFDPDRHPR
jgi:hypothetical protein